MSTATFTDLLRHPKDVVAQTEQGAVRITRRDAEDLVLMRAGDLEGQDRGIALASRLMRGALTHHGDMAAAVKDAFPWTSFLSESGVKQFAAEMDHLVWSSAELGAYGRLLGAFYSWEGTAEAIADGMEPADPATFLPQDQWIEAEYPG